jgi:hypothetical protein
VTPSPPAATEGAPIAIFAYRRSEHLGRLIDSLLDSPLAQRSPLFVFCDGARDQADEAGVAATRTVAHERLGTRAQIVESALNKGLAQSVIAGVSELCQRFGRVIVLEDDLVLHPQCLAFLNAALARYADEQRVFHINAYRYPLPPASAPSFSRLVSSWGWATWQRAWVNFEPDATLLAQRLRDAKLIASLDFGGAFPFFEMLQSQAAGKVDSWAIRWYASTLLRGGLGLYPNVSQVSNAGFDNSGVHCGTGSIYNVGLGMASERWPAQVAEDPSNYRHMQAFFLRTQGTFPRRALRKLKRLLMAG